MRWLEILRQGINRRDLPSIPRVESVVVEKEDRATRGNAVRVGHDFGLIVINGGRVLPPWPISHRFIFGWFIATAR